MRNSRPHRLVARANRELLRDRFPHLSQIDLSRRAHAIAVWNLAEALGEDLSSDYDLVAAVQGFDGAGELQEAGWVSGPRITAEQQRQCAQTVLWAELAAVLALCRAAGERELAGYVEGWSPDVRAGAAGDQCRSAWSTAMPEPR